MRSLFLPHLPAERRGRCHPSQGHTGRSDAAGRVGDVDDGAVGGLRASYSARCRTVLLQSWCAASDKTKRPNAIQVPCRSSLLLLIGPRPSARFASLRSFRKPHAYTESSRSYRSTRCRAAGPSSVLPIIRASWPQSQSLRVPFGPLTKICLGHHPARCRSLASRT